MFSCFKVFYGFKYVFLIPKVFVWFSPQKRLSFARTHINHL